MKKIGSRLFVIYLLYAITVVCIEWMNMFSNLLGFILPFGMAEILSLGLIISFSFLTKERWEVESIGLNAEKCIGIFVIFVFGFIMSVYPDRAYDTHNYHLIAQNPLFENYFTDDFAYGNFQVWGFRLPDRMFYYFRYFLGYRLGTILNPLILIISFTQLYDILEWVLSKHVNNDGFWSRIVCNKLIWSLVILLPLDTILMSGTYYVDIFAIPLALEIIRLFLEDSDKQKSIDICYFALLNGMWIGFKLTNVVYVVPIVLIYIVKHFKSIKLKNWISAILIGLFPFLNYLIFNYICTGNPVFPYFNGIFKSPYFVHLNWKDTSWGAVKLFEKIIWFVYPAFKPEYRQSEIYDFRPTVLIVGLLSALITLYIHFYDRKNERCKGLLSQSKFCILMITTLISSILWSFTTGYVRYFIVGKLLWGLIAYWFLVFITVNYAALGSAISLGCSIAVSVCLCLNLQSSLNGRNWSWQKFETTSFREQIQYLLKDRDIVKDYDIEPDLFVITSQEYMGIAELINDNVYVVNTSYPLNFGDSYRAYYDDRISNADTMYDIHSNLFYNVSEYIERLNVNGLYMSDISPVTVGAGNYYLVDVDKTENLNSIWISNETMLEIPVNGSHNLCFIAGRYYDWEGSPQVFIKITEDETMKELAFVPVDNLNVQKYEIPLTVSSGQLSVRVCYADGTTIPADELNQVFIINWMFS